MESLPECGEQVGGAGASVSYDGARVSLEVVGERGGSLIAVPADRDSKNTSDEWSLKGNHQPNVFQLRGMWTHVDIEVPEMLFDAEGLPIHADKMPTPGAQTSRSGPQLEKEATSHAARPLVSMAENDETLTTDL